MLDDGQIIQRRCPDEELNKLELRGGGGFHIKLDFEIMPRVM